MSTERALEFAAIVNEMPCNVGLNRLKEVNSLRNPSDKLEALQALGKDAIRQLDRIEETCINEIAYLLQHYSLSTVFRLVTDYRNILKETNGNSPALSFFKMPSYIYGERRSNYAKQVKQNNRELRPFYNESEYIQRAVALLNTKSYINVAMGLCAVTGRRPSEILLTAEFKKAGDYAVIFSGQLKTKDSENARDNYYMPTLIEADTVIDALNRLRTLRDFSDIKTKPGQTKAQAVNSKTAKSQGECVKRYFAKFIPEFKRESGKEEQPKPYNLRQVYVLIAINHFCPSDTDETVFASDILGHARDDLATAHSYKVFRYA